MNKILLLCVCLLLSNQSFSQKIKPVQDSTTSLRGQGGYVYAAQKDHSVLFYGFDNIHGNELWISDGTPTGTKIVKDILQGRNSGLDDDMSSIYADGKLYFSARDAAHGNELWVSDGTDTGTRMIKDIYTGFNNGAGYHDLIYYNGKVYFTGITLADGAELWSSDGTANGTQMVKDINPGSGNSSPRGFIIVNGKLFFVAYTSTQGTELWMTDGTTTGTKIVADYYPGSTPGVFDQLNYSTQSVMNNKLFYIGSDKNGLYSTQLLLTDGNSITTLYDSLSYVRYFLAKNGKTYFQADDGVHGSELWVSDGTVSGTKMVKDIWQGKDNSRPTPISFIGDKLIFTANDGIHGIELWISDGTTSGTKLVKDINGNSSSAWIYTHSQRVNRNIKNSFVYDSVFYFAANDGIYGSELWRTDGTDTGTYMVEDANSSPDSSAHSRLEYVFVDSNNVWLNMISVNTYRELHLFKAPVDTSNTPPTSIESFKTKKFTSNIYPNPNNGSFMLTLGSNSFLNGYLKVTDIMGRIVYDQSIAHNQYEVYLNLENIPKGFYNITIQLDSKVETHKVSIE